MYPSRERKAKALDDGRSLNDFPLAEPECIAERPTLAELLARIAARETPALPPAEDVLRELRPSA